MASCSILTLPRGEAPKNLPVIVNPHCGPWARDHWGFNAEARFMVPMAISLGFGILFATLITLALVPTFYMVVEDFRGLFREEAPEEAESRISERKAPG